LVASAEALRSSDRNAFYGWARSAAWVALGAAACLALTMALRNSTPVNGPAPGQVANNLSPQNAVAKNTVAKNDGGADHQLLAVLWPEENADAALADSATTLAETADADAGTVADEDATYEPMPEASAPDWLIAAVAEAGR